MCRAAPVGLAERAPPTRVSAAAPLLQTHWEQCWECCGGGRCAAGLGRSCRRCRPAAAAAWAPRLRALWPGAPHSLRSGHSEGRRQHSLLRHTRFAPRSLVLPWHGCSPSNGAPVPLPATARRSWAAGAPRACPPAATAATASTAQRWHGCDGRAGRLGAGCGASAPAPTSPAWARGRGSRRHPPGAAGQGRTSPAPWHACPAPARWQRWCRMPWQTACGTMHCWQRCRLLAACSSSQMHSSRRSGGGGGACEGAAPATSMLGHAGPSLQPAAAASAAAAGTMTPAAAARPAAAGAAAVAAAVPPPSKQPLPRHGSPAGRPLPRCTRWLLSCRRRTTMPHSPAAAAAPTLCARWSLRSTAGCWPRQACPSRCVGAPLVGACTDGRAGGCDRELLMRSANAWACGLRCLVAEDPRPPLASPPLPLPAPQVRVYSLASRLQHPGDEAYLRPLRCHRMPSKLSCLAWNPDAPGTVTGGRGALGRLEQLGTHPC